MTSRQHLSPATDVTVTIRGHLPGAADYAREKIGSLFRRIDRPVLHARVKLSRHPDPAVATPVVAQANLDVEGRVVRAQVEGQTVSEAVDLLEARLRGRLERVADNWETRRGRRPLANGEWRHESVRRPPRRYFPRPVEDRRIVRRKSFAAPMCTIDEAAWDLEMLDYDFYLFVEEPTGIAGVLYRDGEGGYRLAQVVSMPDAPHTPPVVPVSRSTTPAPCITVAQAIERLELLGWPFLFFIDAAQGRASVLYHRYDGHYGLLSPAS